ncbi:MAG: endonuclease/exonuclease/phosphatase family protein [Opitutaceae bacterium]|nr:endonuclease/exonuclease/phosphatase family protein [Opitutaceae bacterium]
MFWNTGRGRVLEPLAELCAEWLVDVVILAEPAIELGTLLTTLHRATGRVFVRANPWAKGKIVVVTALPFDRFRPTSDGVDFSFVHFTPPLGPSVLVGGVHLPSRVSQSQDEQVFGAVRMRDAIEAAERTSQHTRTVVIGDFNMNPFDPGVVAADAFHAVCDRRIALRGSRTVRGEDRRFFYNPMWNLLGDAPPDPPATYYRADAGHHVQFWEMFDQCLVRPELIPFLPENGVQIVSSTRNHKLADDRGRPRGREYSDHFPILLTLKKGASES